MPRDYWEWDLLAYWSVMEAREGNPTRLADRLRNGVPLSRAERCFLADWIEDKAKPRKPRPTKSGRAVTPRERLDIVQEILFIEAMNPGRQRKTIIPDVSKFHGVSERFVYGLLDGMDPEHLKAISWSAAAFAEWQSSIAHK